MLKSFFLWNYRVSEKIRAALNLDRLSERATVQYYLQVVGDYLHRQEGQTVLDIGTGRQLIYSPMVTSAAGAHIIGCDISKEELACNADITDSVVCDASESIPLADESVDLLTSHMCLEHLQDTSRFMAEAARILKPGGSAILFFAGKYGIHSWLNRVLPHHFVKQALAFLRPELKRGVFPSYYDRTGYQAFQHVIQQHGFRVDAVGFNYNFKAYLAFFIPFYFLGIALDWLRWCLKLHGMADSYLFILYKPLSPSRLQN